MVKLGNRGLTLLEAILGAAILGIVAVSMFALFSNAIFNLKRSGERTEALYNSQSIIETNSATSASDDVLTISFDDLELDINISIFEVETEYGRNGSKASIYYFAVN